MAKPGTYRRVGKYPVTLHRALHGLSTGAASLPVESFGKEELLLPEAVSSSGSGPTFCFLEGINNHRRRSTQALQELLMLGGDISIDRLLMGQNPHACHTNGSVLVLRSLAQG